MDHRSFFCRVFRFVFISPRNQMINITIPIQVMITITMMITIPIRITIIVIFIAITENMVK